VKGEILVFAAERYNSNVADDRCRAYAPVKTKKNEEPYLPNMSSAAQGGTNATRHWPCVDATYLVPGQVFDLLEIGAPSGGARNQI
jgi:hypothetical protein